VTTGEYPLLYVFGFFFSLFELFFRVVSEASAPLPKRGITAHVNKLPSSVPHTVIIALN